MVENENFIDLAKRLADKHGVKSGEGDDVQIQFADYKRLKESEDQVLSVDTQLANEVNVPSIIDVQPATPQETEQEKQNREAKEQEKQKMITLLQAFFKEKNHNTKAHTKMAEQISKMEDICKRALPYVKALFSNNDDYTNYEINRDWFSELKNYPVITCTWLERDGKKYGLLNPSDSLQTLLQKEEYKDDAALKTLIDEYRQTLAALQEGSQQLFQEKKTIARELIDTAFQERRNQTLVFQNSGLYNVDRVIWIEQEGNLPQLVFSQGKNSYGEINIRNLQERFDISDDELAKIQKIDWSDENKAKLGQFVEAAEDFGADKTEEIKNELAASFPGFKFSAGNLDQLACIYREGAIRNLYTTLDLPPQHESLVLTKFMLNQFDF